ncbi:proline racemase family protein [Dactylosporangium sp. CS-047395]|uniref:proline racemase family protein n=1 Tax=Dactylosporangium sp. CS-047395 TaxID=3239936 RepID=UPI003D8E7011
MRTVDFHTGGEPFRIVPEPPVELRGATVAERRVFAMGDPGADGLRRLLCFEPRGHADMYGGFITPPDAASVGLRIVPEHHQELIALGREIKWALDADPVARHPTDERLSGVYGTILYEHLGTTDDGALHQRNVTIFADGELDRSPCGSGTAARVATLTASAELASGQTLVHDSIVGSRFTAVATAGPDGTVVPVISGMAYPTGEHTFIVDPGDPLTPGFVLR